MCPSNRVRSNLRYETHNKVNANAVIQTKQGSSLILLLFVLPHIIFSIQPSKYNSAFLVGIAMLQAVFISRELFRGGTVLEAAPLLFATTLVWFGLINGLFNGKFSFFNFYTPIVTYFGYSYLRQHHFSSRILLQVLVLLYVYFYFVYFRDLPDLFLRPGFDEDDYVFDNSSSNAIPISLNFTLLFAAVLSLREQTKPAISLLVFASVNVGLTIIQQSRIGISCAVFLLVVLAGLKISGQHRAVLGCLLSICITFFLAFDSALREKLIDAYDLIQALSLIADIRGMAQAEFFNLMRGDRWIFGHPPNTVFAVGADGVILYTYNVILDMWGRYSLVSVITLIVLLARRVLFSRRFRVPLIFMVPLVAYGSVESLFFPNYWDPLIFIVLFEPNVYTQMSPPDNDRFPSGVDPQRKLV